MPHFIATQKITSRSAVIAMIESFCVRNKKAFNIVHILAFISFFILIAVPLFLPDPAENSTAWNHLAIFAQEAIWTVWFPLVFISVIFTGRSWCGLICPMGAASEWVNKLGPKLPIPRFIEWSGTPVVSFLVVTIWGQMVGIRNHPEALAWVFGITMLAALMVGFLFGKNKRVWCRHMCPIGLMLGVFSRLGITTFTPKRPKSGPEQIVDKNVCPTRISLPYKKESRHCIACFRCVSPCAKGGLFLDTRKSGKEIANITYNNPNLAEIIFLFLSTGLSIGGFMWLILPSYQAIRQMFGNLCLKYDLTGLLLPGPSWLVSVHPERHEVLLWMDAVLISGYMVAWMCFVSALMAMVTYVITRITHKSSNKDFCKRFIEIGYHLIPVAMVSLLIGLGGNLFNVTGNLFLGKSITSAIKITLILASIIWGVQLCKQILREQKVVVSRMAILCSYVGNFMVASCWLPAIL